MLNLKRHNYDSLIVGLEATPLKKSIPLSEKITTVKEKPLGECYLSLVRGGAILTSLHLDKTTNPPSLQSGKTKFFLWFFFYCHNFSRLRELLFFNLYTHGHQDMIKSVFCLPYDTNYKSRSYKCFLDKKNCLRKLFLFVKLNWIK